LAESKKAKLLGPRFGIAASVSLQPFLISVNCEPTLAAALSEALRTAELPE